MSTAITITRKTFARTFYVTSTRGNSFNAVHEDGALRGWIERRNLTGKRPEFRAVEYRTPEPNRVGQFWHSRRIDALEELEVMTRRFVGGTVTREALAATSEPEELLELANTIATTRERTRPYDSFNFDGIGFLIFTREDGSQEVETAPQLDPWNRPSIAVRTLSVAAELDDDEPQFAKDKATGELVFLNGNRVPLRSL